MSSTGKQQRTRSEAERRLRRSMFGFHPDILRDLAPMPRFVDGDEPSKDRGDKQQ